MTEKQPPWVSKSGNLFTSGFGMFFVYANKLVNINIFMKQFCDYHTG